MDRYFGKPEKSQASTGTFTGVMRSQAGLPMKQIPIAREHWPLHPPTLCVSWPAYDPNSGFVQSARQDGTFNKEFTGEH
jgi:hypothetical protein